MDERLKDSKQLLLIVTENTKNGSNIVKHEIIQAIDKKEIPVILVYVGKETVKKVTPNMIEQLPPVLKTRINNKQGKFLFIPFKLKAIKTAVDNFGVNDLTDKGNDVYRYSNVDSWD